MLPKILQSPPVPPYKSFNGSALTPSPLRFILKAGAFTTLRLRLFVNPAPIDMSTLAYTLRAAQEATAAGANVMLALHFSDTWADPGRQDVPAAWKRCGRNVSCIARRVEAYTRDTVNAFVDAGVDLAAVQLGNEVRNGMLWPTGRLKNLSCKRAARMGGQLAYPGAPAAFDAIAAYLRAGLRGLGASRGSTTPSILHIDRGDCLATTRSALGPLDVRGAVKGFDLLGFSYHPKHHNRSLTDVQATLGAVAADYGKDVALVEVGFPFTGGQWENRSAKWDWDVTRMGQAAFVRDLIRVVEGVGRPQRRKGGGQGVGIFWWQPELVAGYGIDAWEDGRYSLFDANAQALPALAAFGQREGVACAEGGKPAPPHGRRAGGVKAQGRRGPRL